MKNIIPHQMKKTLHIPIIVLLMVLQLSQVFAQESITNIVVTPKTDGTGMVDIYYDLNGPESDYTITLEASLDGGNNYTPVANTCLTGDVGPVQPGTGKYLIWDGICSNSETYSTQTKIKIIASYSGGTGTPCPGTPTVTDIDGNTYNTVQIGTQCWMAENLNVGTHIYLVNNQTNNSQIEKYCYDDDPANCVIYGGLYQWDEMMQYVTSEGVQGICPAGWHLPSDNEWKTMEMHLGMSQAQADATSWRGTDEGNKLKEIGNTHWSYSSPGVTNSSGFTALPGGNGFRHLGKYGYWWSSTEYSDVYGTYGWNRSLGYIYDRVGRTKYGKAAPTSVRCLKN